MKIFRIFILCLSAIVVGGLIKYAPLLWLFTAGLRTPAQAPQPDYWPTKEWRISSPEEQGIDSAKLAEGILSMQKNKVNVDSLMIVRNGYVILDAHFSPYDGKFPHDLASVTKSVITMLIGIAADQGKLDLDQKVISFFPDRTIANMDDMKSRLTVRDLVSMRNGMESICDDDEGTLNIMRNSNDWVQAALDRPMMAKPGKYFCYDSPGMHLLSAILQEATGMTAVDFAQQYLFSPLGIKEFIWEEDPQGYSRGWGDLHLLPEDLAKIGFLWLHRGVWDGQQIVSEAWVLDSVRAHSKFVEPDFGYGYGWWITGGDYQASGRGGQRVRVIASINTLVVVTASDDDYSEIGAWLNPLLIAAKKPLPSNPGGFEVLQAALSQVEESDYLQFSGYQPEITNQVSEKTYVCETNPANIKFIDFEFENGNQANLKFNMNGVDQEFVIGTDGNYRISPTGTGFLGYWRDQQTFEFLVFNIGVIQRTVVFDDNKIELFIPEANLSVPCQTLDL